MLWIKPSALGLFVEKIALDGWNNVDRVVFRFVLR